MATGDITDVLARLRAVLPQRWFPDTTPVLDAVLTGTAAAWSGLYALLQIVAAQARIATASDQFLDAVSADFFGAALPRRRTEGDDAFRSRIDRELLREKGTRAAISSVLTDLTDPNDPQAGQQPFHGSPFGSGGQQFFMRQGFPGGGQFKFQQGGGGFPGMFS